MRHTNSRRLQAGYGFENVQQFLECQIPIAQDVALSRSSTLEREQVSGGYIFDVDYVEAGLDIRRHSSIQKSQNYFTCWSGFNIVGADRGRGIYDNYVLSPSRAGERFLLGQEFGLFVIADEAVQRGLGLFAGYFARGRYADS